jgi:septation ring formation regulator EzrA
MQLVEIEPVKDGAVTLKLSRDEYHLVRDALSEAIEHLEENLHKDKEQVKQLEGKSEEEVFNSLDEDEEVPDSLEDLEWRIKSAEKFLSKADGFKKTIEGITRDHDLARLL